MEILKSTWCDSLKLYELHGRGVIWERVEVRINLKATPLFGTDEPDHQDEMHYGLFSFPTTSDDVALSE